MPVNISGTGKKFGGAPKAVTTQQVKEADQDEPGPVEVTDHDVPITAEMVGLPTDHPAQVHVEAGATIPTAPYANVRIGVAVTIPCALTHIEPAFVQGRQWVDEHMLEMKGLVDKAKGEIDEV